MNKPTVSILLSVYNGRETLARCLHSIEQQTYRSWQIIAIDDASDDGSHSILKEWQLRLGQDRLVIVTNQTNLGLTKSLNNGLKVIDTPLTARIDADDWWDSEKLTKQVEFLRLHIDCGVVGCQYINIYGSKELRSKLPVDDRAIRARIFMGNPFAHSCVLFRTDLVKKLGGYDETIRYGQDYDLWLRAYGVTQFHNLPEYLCFRSVESGISVDNQSRQMRQGMKTQLKYLKRYHRPLHQYLSLISLWIISLAPRWVSKLRRQLSR